MPSGSPRARLSTRELATRVARRIWEDDVFGRAAGLSYYFLFALFPTLLFLTALIGLLPFPDLMDLLMDYADQVMPADAASLLRRTLDEVVTGASGGLLSVGVIAALWGASSGMASMMAALNRALKVADQRPWWRRRLVAIALTLGFSLFTLTALLLLVFGEWIGEVLARRAGLGSLFAATWPLLQWPLVIGLALTGVALVYWLAPAVGRRWALVTPGTVFALLAWLLTSLGLRLYVAQVGGHNATYGSIGGVILLMLWLYASGVALLVGAEIDSEIEAAATAEARLE